MTPGPLPRRSLLRAGALLGLGSVLGACTEDGSDREVSSAALGPRRRGGVLRIGTTGRSGVGGLDPHNAPKEPNHARISNLYEPLFSRDPAYNIEPVLAESIEQSEQGRVWTLRLRDGVEFHNGKRLDADDVIFTLHRMADHPLAVSVVSNVDLAGLRKMDARTLRVPLKRPYVLFPDELAQYYFPILPVGFDIGRPVGTGPFRFGSFRPGDRSSFIRFDHYWRSGQPYVDELVIIDLPDDQARVNALLNGDVEAIDNLPQTQVAAVKAAGANVLSSETGAWTPFTMRVDVPPFDDVRVRRAFRLIVNRDEMVSQALNGQGRIANDLFAPFDVAYARDLPQRRQDLDQARSLLRQAGREGVQVELVTSNGIGAGAVQAARLFAQQAKGAGVDVRVREVDSGVFFGADYLSWPFAQDYWFTRSYLPQVSLVSLPDAPVNQCHWNDPKFNSLIAMARGELDQGRRNRLVEEAQRIEYDSGGFIIWGFKNQVDAYASHVTGFVADRNLPLSSYQFRTISFV
jgi:peptide/nickel transport system substrate-binding protein